jgi:hypothetical protein
MTKTPTPHADDEYSYPIAHMTFEPVPFDFDSIPSNEEAAELAARAMPVFRMAALMTRFGDKELEQFARQEPEANLELLECIASQMKATKNHLRILELGFTRLSVALERYANDQEAEASN